ncbi:hypothetical protein BGW38_003290 [Lunasporangiospora selenospora]|uniref:Uncharacterized protein n=1 Tax=Lunasporangiospora selenospora TaxID=979761 RepID=A0A9P6FRM8_9FUNG|nr:hypothetical protein BGW38_003290 [Lunasporangiospora selenospora]
MTNPDSEDFGDFDVKDISSMLKDMDSLELALDTFEGKKSTSRTDRLTANLASLLNAQAQPNPFQGTEEQAKPSEPSTGSKNTIAPSQDQQQEQQS